MRVRRYKRLLIFEQYTNYEYQMLKSLLCRSDKYFNRKVNMLFSYKGKPATYFGYLELLKHYFQIELIDDNKIEPVTEIPAQVGKYKLRDYQQFAVKRAIESRYGNLSMSVGAGKTVVMLAIAYILNKPTLIIEPTQQLVEQVYNVFVDSGAFNPEDIGMLYGKEKRLSKITIATFQTVKNMIYKNPKEMAQFKVILNDESQITQQSETGLFIDEFYSDKADYILGFSGTLYRALRNLLDKKQISKLKIEDFIMLGFTGKPIVEIPMSYLVMMGYLAKPYVYFDVVDRPVMQSDNWHIIKKELIDLNQYRNSKIVNWINYFADKNLTSLTLVDTKRHAKEIAKLLPQHLRNQIYFVFGNGLIQQYDGSRFRTQNITYAEVMSKLNNRQIKGIIATQVFNQGTDIPNLNALILAFGGRSLVSIYQRIGRVLRKTELKHNAFIIDFFDSTSPYLEYHSKWRKYCYSQDGLTVVDDRAEFDKIVEFEVNRIKEAENKINEEFDKQFIGG